MHLDDRGATLAGCGRRRSSRCCATAWPAPACRASGRSARSTCIGGKPHDAGFPIHRFMRWISEEAAQA